MLFRWRVCPSFKFGLKEKTNAGKADLFKALFHFGATCSLSSRLPLNVSSSLNSQNEDDSPKVLQDLLEISNTVPAKRHEYVESQLSKNK